MSRILGVDYGTRRVGFAVSDPAGEMAFPHSMAECSTEPAAVEAVRRTMGETGAVRVVIGLPLNMDGSEGPRVQSARAFARNLLRLQDLPIAFWDERMSTMAVNRFLIDELDASRAKRAGLVDQMAAGWILQGALDRLRSLET